jgi:type IV secretory pathway ATPase VirB11/archaellum biosynthesis ATPase
MGTNKLYEHICKKYPEIEYKGEDLRIENIYLNLIKSMWHNRDKYPNVKVIADKINLSERHVYRLAQRNGLGMRAYKPR